MRYKKQKFSACHLILLVLLTLTTSAIIADSDSFSLGKSEYEQGNYQKALTYLDTTIKQDPTDATAFYYRANTLVNLGLKTQALTDYQQAYKLTNSALMRDYCLKAMSSLTRNVSLPALKSKNSTALNPANIIKQDELNQSLGAIQLQSALDKVRIIGNGELFAQDYTMKQQLKLADMKRQTEQEAQGMQNAVYYDQYGTKHPVYSVPQMQSYLDQRHQMEQDIQDSIQKSVQGQTQFAKDRAQLTQESAANLTNQLQGGASPDGMKLDPLGTNLYVRNYDFTNNPDFLAQPPTELTAKKKSLKPKEKHPNN